MQDSLLIRLSLSSCPPPDLSHVVCVAVSQTFGGNALLFYWIMLGNSALAGTWMLHLAKFLWETVFERLIFHNQAEPARVSSMHPSTAHRTYARHTLAMPAAHIAFECLNRQTLCWSRQLAGTAASGGMQSALDELCGHAA